MTTPFRAMSGLCVGSLIGAPVGGLIIGAMTSVKDYNIIHGPVQKAKEKNEQLTASVPARGLP